MWEKGLWLRGELERAQVQPDTVSYNAAISSCEKGVQWEKALWLLAEQMIAYLQPDAISYAATISSCERK